MADCCKYKFITVLLILLSCYVVFTQSQLIHRSVSHSDYQHKYENQNTNFFSSWMLKEKAEGFLNCTFAFQSYENTIWIASVISALLVGLCGVVPVLILPQLTDDHKKLVKSPTFKCFVAFAAGTLLADVFLHLLPETFTRQVLSNRNQTIINGVWLLIGVFAFFSLEKLFPDEDEETADPTNSHLDINNNSIESKHSKEPKSFLNSIKTVGLLNLFANVIDNFTHGIAVAGSFQASFKFGVMTLIATLLHEIPHEIGDFAILLKSGLNYQQAALAQLITATAGVSGAIFALSFSSAEQAGDLTSWILPFTSGGFLYIALVGILPEILMEKCASTSAKQILCLKMGIVIIYVLTHFFD